MQYIEKCVYDSDVFNENVSDSGTVDSLAQRMSASGKALTVIGGGGAMRMRGTSSNRVSKEELKKKYLGLSVFMEAFKSQIDCDFDVGII